MHFHAYTKQARQVMRTAQNLACEKQSRLLGTEDILLAMLREKNGVAGQVLRGQSIQEETVRRVISEMILPDPAEPDEIIPEGMQLLPETEAVLERASQLARQYESETIGTEHLLLSLLEHPDCAATQILTVLTVNPDQMYGEVLFAMGRPMEYAKIKKVRLRKREEAGTPLLEQFSTDLTARARAGELDPLIGRETELTRMIQTLSRRGKNNPCLIGEPGVGKTAIVEGLARRIAEGSVPDFLQGRRILALDVAGMVAGTKYRGEFEERMKGIIKEAEGAKDILLFIDELHTIIGAGGAEGALDAANIMKPALSRGKLQVIGATTVQEYRKRIEKDAALERRFQSILVEEPDIEETVKILTGLRDRYEVHHGVEITDEGVRAAAELSARYISERFLPDKAIDLMDEAAAKIHLRNVPKTAETTEEEKEVAQAGQMLEEALRNGRIAEAAALRLDLQKAREAYEKAAGKQHRSRRKLTVGAGEVADVVSEWTHIPVRRLTEDESVRLKRMEKSLHKRVIAQDEAVQAVAKAVRRGRVGLKDPARPIGSFLFLGPTGVGKTEISKALAQEVFGTEDAMIRVDMSEYMEKHSVSRMIGSPPGYVGYDEGGQLSEQVRRHPYSVILFDEIEKAHPDVFNILLQVLDDGHVTDAQGRKVDFKNTIIIMTSNAGAKSIVEPKKLGFAAVEDEQQNYERMKANVMDEVRRIFRPEFLNRIDETIVFHALTKEHMKQIVSLMTGELEQRCRKQLGIELTVRDSVKRYIVEKAYDPKYGARPLRRAIQTMLEDRLSDEILAGRVKSGQAVAAAVHGGEIVFLA
ncbi:MAG: ATP-dependent Clp protease ATP-binding subunit [Clostridiales bacterium]|nr:ATP-dependent Clp protease ATP-binding subunit [Clostridiales bacterium]